MPDNNTKLPEEAAFQPEGCASGFQENADNLENTGQTSSEVAKLAREIADRQNPVTGSLWSAAYVAAKAALLEGERRERERCAQIAESFNATPAFDSPCSPFDRTVAIATAIRSAKP